MFFDDNEEEDNLPKPQPAYDPYASIQSQQVREYMRQKMETKKALDDAQGQQKWGDYAGVAGSIATDLVNANKPQDVILSNSFNKMGSSPEVRSIADKKIDFSGVKGILDAQAQRAQAKYNQVDQDFTTQRNADAADKQYQAEDPTSKRSKTAQVLAQSAINSRISEAEKAGDKAGAEKLRSIDVSGMPASEAKDLYDGLKSSDYKDVLNNQATDKRLKSQLASEERREKNKLDAEERKDRKPSEQFKQLPIDNQEQIKELSKKNANKESIANQIDSMLALADKAKDDSAKLAIYRQMGKVLNSTEGADAVGADEAKRLLSKLEFAVGNFTNNNPTQWGRDLDGFKDQAKATSDSVRGSIKANQAVVDKLYNRQPSAPAPNTTQNNSTGQVSVMAPNGRVKIIPADQVSAAVAAGGKVVQ